MHTTTIRVGETNLNATLLLPSTTFSSGRAAGVIIIVRETVTIISYYRARPFAAGRPCRRGRHLMVSPRPSVFIRGMMTRPEMRPKNALSKGVAIMFFFSRQDVTSHTSFYRVCFSRLNVRCVCVF